VFYCGVWDDEGLAEAHDELDGEEEFEVEERLLSRFGMSEYYGSEGFDRPTSDVSVLVRRWLPTSAMTGLGRERLSPWYDADLCLFVLLCGCVCSLEWVPRSFVCRPSDLCVCRVGTPPAR